MTNDLYITLTPNDHLILQSYMHTLSGLGDYLGAGYEIILHSLENLENSVIKIINGHYSGRKEGAPITDFALSMLKKIQDSNEHGPIVYLNKDKQGSLLKSTTIPIMGDHEKIIGLICINFYTNTPLYSLLTSLLSNECSIPTEPTYQETFSESIDDVITTTLNTVREAIYSDSRILTHNKNKEIITTLYEKGIFNIKDSVIKVSELLNISKNTVYMHLRNLKSS